MQQQSLLAKALARVLEGSGDEDRCGTGDARLDRGAVAAAERAALNVELDGPVVDRFLRARLALALRRVLSSLAPERRVRVEVLRAGPYSADELDLERNLRAESGKASPGGTVTDFAPPLPAIDTSHVLVLAADEGSRQELSRGEFGRARGAGLSLRRRDAESDLLWDRGPVQIVPLEELSERVCNAIASGRNGSRLRRRNALARGDEDRSGSLLDGRYLLMRRLGMGGFGAVYEARDLSLGNRVAIKLLRTNEPRKLRGLKEEARRLTRLNHPHIVDWKTFGELENGSCYLVMELLEGEDLARRSRREGPFGPVRAASILLQILDALRTAHFLGDRDSLLHLDLKPQNVLLVEKPGGGSRDWVKLIDFGIGQRVKRPQARPDASPDDPLVVLREATPSETVAVTLGARTAEGGCTGCTPEYASPEHCAHLLPDLDPLPLDGRSDLYSLGVVGYELLTGQLPITEPDQLGLASVKQYSTAPRLEGESGVPRRLARFIDRCLELRREDRWPDARVAYDEMERIVHRPRARIGLAVTSIVASILALTLAFRSTAAPAFDILLERRGGAAALLEGPLILGPDRPSERLLLRGVGTSAAIVSAGLVEDAGGAPLAGAQLIPSRSGVLDLTLSGAGGREMWTAYVELDHEDGTTSVSRPISLVWLGRDAIGNVEARVPGLDGRELDPIGARVEVAVKALSEDIEAVYVGADGKSVRAQRDATRVGRERPLVFAVDAEALELDDGAQNIVATVVNRAQGTRRADLDVTVTTSPLRFLEAEIKGLRWGSAHFLQPDTDPILSVHLSHPATLLWSVVDDTGQTLIEGQGEVDRRHEICLAGLMQGRGEPLRASLRVSARDAHHVLRVRQHERGHDDVELDLIYLPGPSRVELAIDLGDGTTRPLTSDPPLFTGVRELALVLHRSSPVPTEFRLAVVESDGDWRWEHVERLNGPLSSSVSVPLGLPGPGVYDIEITSWRSDVGLGPAGVPPQAVRARVVLDEAIPVLTLDRPTDPVVRDLARPLEIPVAIRDSGPWGDPTGLAVHWLLVATPGAPPAAQGETRLGRGGDVLLSLTLGESLDPDAEDGPYRIGLSVQDAAGNRSAEEWTEITLDRRSPTISLLQPLPEVSWAPDEDGLRRLRVLALDGNGVERVDCQIVQVGDPKREVLRELEADEADPRQWTCGIRFSETWSDTDVEIVLTARDHAGSVSVQTFLRPLGLVHSSLPPLVRSRGTAMALVEGNDSPYVFGGRLDDLERETFRDAGLANYNESALPQSWRVEYPPGAIDDFYLDVHETSVGQYLRFLEDEAGYANRAHWPTGTAPDEHRNLELASVLTSLPPDDPATGLAWGEAWAYARWAGKRLPTVVEWEFAVRGPGYRPWSAWRPGSGGPSPRDVNYLADPASPAAPWKVLGVGGDRTPETGLWNLAGNVSEWTASPTSFLPSGEWPVDSARHARRFALSLLDPMAWESASSSDIWIAGGSYTRVRFDFSVLEGRARHWRADDVGFRCATSAAEVALALESGSGMFDGVDAGVSR